MVLSLANTEGGKRHTNERSNSGSLVRPCVQVNCCDESISHLSTKVAVGYSTYPLTDIMKLPNKTQTVRFVDF